MFPSSERIRSEPTYKSPPVVTIPPLDARVTIPTIFALPPTFKLFSIPTPPSV